VHHRALGWVLVAAVGVAAVAPAHALNKQGARKEDTDGEEPVFNVSGYLFGGAFLFNPSYAARPNNSGIALFRFGLHVDVDLYKRWLTLSYDMNSFTDGQGGVNPLTPSEYDHILGLLSNIGLPHGWDLTLAVHWELDMPGNEQAPARRPPDYVVGYTQSYADAYVRATWTGRRLMAFVALGGFVYNPTYASRPDNSGLALLRYVVHGEARLLPWLTYRLDFNFFTDRDTAPVTPTELDVTSEIGIALGRSFELRLLGEADLPIGLYPAGGPHPTTTPGLRQVYLAGLLQANFDVQELIQRWRRRR